MAIYVHDDREQLAEIISALKAGLVVLDGCSGAGKTCLANWLGRTFDNIAIIHVDYFVAPNIEEHCRAVTQGGSVYITILQNEKLRSTVLQSLNHSPLVILEGVCMRDVLDRIGFTPALHVYVQRNSRMGVMSDLDIIDQEDDDPPPMDDPSPLDGEIATYHARQMPRRRADVVFIRVGD